MALTLVEQSLMFCRRKPRTLFSFPAVIAVCLDHVRLSVIEMPRYLLVSDVSSILLCMAYNVSQASLVFFGITLMAVHFPGLNSICQSFSHCSSDDRSDWRACWSLSVVMLLRKRQSSANSLVWEERTTSRKLLIYESKRRGPLGSHNTDPPGDLLVLCVHTTIIDLVISWSFGLIQQSPAWSFGFTQHSPAWWSPGPSGSHNNHPSWPC